MIDIEIYMRVWLRWNKRSDAREIARVGWKASGIEYRIMHDAGVIENDEVKYHSPNETMAQMVDLAYCSLAQCGYDDMMRTLEVYFLRKKSIKATAASMGQSRDKTKRLVKEGSLLMQGAILIQEIQREVKLAKSE